MKVDSIELCPEKDSTPARDLELIFKEVEGEPYSSGRKVESVNTESNSKKDNTPAGVIPCAVTYAGKNGKIAAATNLPFSPVICMDVASIEPKFVTPPYND